MDITVIGTGNMARRIETRALAGGHTVTLHGTDAAKASGLAASRPMTHVELLDLEPCRNI